MSSGTLDQFHSCRSAALGSLGEDVSRCHPEHKMTQLSMMMTSRGKFGSVCCPFRPHLDLCSSWLIYSISRNSPLCIEEFDLSDKNFKPCPCGYQVRVFLLHLSDLIATRFGLKNFFYGGAVK